MRKPDLAMHVAYYLIFAWSCAALAESPQPPSKTKAPSGIEATKKTTKPAPNAPVPTHSKVRKRLDQPGNAASGAPKKISESSLSKLDEKNLGLGCAQP